MSLSRRIVWFAMIALSVGAMPARADIKAVYVDLESNSTMMTVYVDNAGRSRIEREDRIFLIDGAGERFDIRREKSGGPLLVMRQRDETRAIVERWTEVMKTLPAPDGDLMPLAFNVAVWGPTVVGDRPGMAYSLKMAGGENFFGGADDPRFGDTVISTDPALAPIGKALASEMESSSDALAPVRGTSNADLKLFEIFRKGTPIRFVGGRLDTVANAPLDPALFDLPGPVLSPDQVRAVVRREMPDVALPRK
jgi:hypothetical protein